MSMENQSALALDGLENDGFFVFENYLSANIMQQVSGILERLRNHARIQRPTQDLIAVIFMICSSGILKS